MQQFWNERYQENEHVYGEAPNAFFKSFIDPLQPGTLLLPAEGEGRNAIYAASRGWVVEAFDYSEVAREKALKRAASKGVSIRYDLQDMFGAGKLAMVIAPNSLPTYIATKGYTDVNYAVADIPHNEGKTSSSVGVMDRIMAFKDDSAPDQAARNEAIGKFLTFFYDPENYVGWVSMEDFLPAVNSAVAALVEANPSFEAWLKVLDGCKFYPTAKTEWIDVKQGAAAVEQSALTGGDVKTLLDELQAKVTK